MAKTRTTKKAATRKGTRSAKATTKKTASKTSGAGGKAKAKKLSAIDAAAQVLGAAKEPMNTKEMIDAMAAKGL